MSLESFIADQKVVSCQESASISDVAKLMRDEDVGCVIIEDQDHKPKGVVTDRDLTLRCIAEDLDCRETEVSEVMSSPVETILVTAGIYDCASKMQKAECRRMIVVDENGKACGVISSGDLLSLFITELDLLAKVTSTRDQGRPRAVA